MNSIQQTAVTFGLIVGVLVMTQCTESGSNQPPNRSGSGATDAPQADAGGHDHDHDHAHADGHSHGDGHKHGDGHDHSHDDGHDHGHAHSHHPHAAALKNPDGSWKYTNKLVNESSPYLLQHAHNPVDWWPWGPEAFEEARKTGKPIFLSIGYSTCYWCHVMERLVFENPAIAEQMNKLFVCVKVDREERPDVDDIYMAATQAMTNHGGWPMSVFLTPPGAQGEDDPGLKPFYAGTYFPPEPQRGMPGFPQVMQYMHEVWTGEREKVFAQANQLTEAVKAYLSRVDRSGDLNMAVVEAAAGQLMRLYDADHGGFGGGRNKFPTPNNLLFLYAAHRNSPDEGTLEALSYTLERMARGGIYDHVGGGFHRYAVDRQWLVPHFEKMLYDNGQLIEAYLTGRAVKPDPADPGMYERIVRETCDYVLREMLDETGTFWSAQDAEVDAKEGDNYVWVESQVRDAVEDKELADLALQMYGLSLGSNFKDPHDPLAKPVNVLFLPRRLDELAKAKDMTLDDLLAKQKAINEQMYPVRMKRPQPRTDDKVLVSWNGIMIGAMARAGRELEEDRYTQAAAKAARYILDHMRSDDGGLHRTMRKGESKINAFLEDYAFLTHGLVELYRTEKSKAWLDAAEEVTALAHERFAAADGGYFDTLADQADLFVRTRTTYDGAVPSGNSQTIHNLIDLHELTGKADYLDRAAIDLQSFAGALNDQGAGMAHMQHALLRAVLAAPDKFKQTTTAAAANAGAPKPVTVSVDPASVDLSSGEAKVTVTIKIADGYHINAAEPGAEGLVPTTFALGAAKGVTLDVTAPKPLTKKYAFADQPLNVYEGEVVFSVTLRRADPAAAANAKPVLLLNYQACTDKLCLAPKEVEVPVGIK